MTIIFYIGYYLAFYKKAYFHSLRISCPPEYFQRNTVPLFHCNLVLHMFHMTLHNKTLHYQLALRQSLRTFLES